GGMAPSSSHSRHSSEESEEEVRGRLAEGPPSHAHGVPARHYHRPRDEEDEDEEEESEEVEESPDEEAQDPAAARDVTNRHQMGTSDYALNLLRRIHANATGRKFNDQQHDRPPAIESRHPSPA
ncbi:hypothetical protein FRC00_011190, partial [Tulasnella sp. 408]